MQNNAMTQFVCVIPRNFEFNRDSMPEKLGQNVFAQGNQSPITNGTSGPSSPVIGMGRVGTDVKFTPDPNKCLCNRPQCTVVCKNCGFKAFGRICYKCPKHPETSFLLDWPQCPHCRGYCLSEY